MPNYQGTASNADIDKITGLQSNAVEIDNAVSLGNTIQGDFTPNNTPIVTGDSAKVAFEKAQGQINFVSSKMKSVYLKNYDTVPADKKVFEDGHTWFMSSELSGTQFINRTEIPNYANSVSEAYLIFNTLLPALLKGVGGFENDRIFDQIWHKNLIRNIPSSFFVPSRPNFTLGDGPDMLMSPSSTAQHLMLVIATNNNPTNPVIYYAHVSFSTGTDGALVCYTWDGSSFIPGSNIFSESKIFSINADNLSNANVNGLTGLKSLLVKLPVYSLFN